MEKNLTYYRLTVKDGTGVSIIVITDDLNKPKVLESAKEKYDVEEIPEDTELLRNARVVSPSVSKAPTDSIPFTVLERYTPSQREIDEIRGINRKAIRQQHKYAVRQYKSK